MSQQPHDLQQERELLEHFRQHSQGEPSAAVDALILDAARQAVSPSVPRPNPVQRLHAWLFGAGSRTRWSVAVAGLAVVGIGLNLTLHTREQVPPVYDAPAPASAPVVQEMAPVAEARKQSAEPEHKKAKQAEKAVAGSMERDAFFSVSPAAPQPIPPAMSQAAPSLADSPAAQGAPEADRGGPVKAMTRQANSAEIKAEAALDEQQSAAPLGLSSVAEAPDLESRLRTLLQLRQEGKTAQADSLLAALKQAFPQRDLEAELKRIQGEAKKPAISR